MKNILAESRPVSKQFPGTIVKIMTQSLHPTLFVQCSFKIEQFNKRTNKIVDNNF